MSRFFRYGELPLVLLALIEQEPLNGYELMGELERLFGPAYQPSAGACTRPSVLWRPRT